jgi:hypothetical protein
LFRKQKLRPRSIIRTSGIYEIGEDEGTNFIALFMPFGRSTFHCNQIAKGHGCKRLFRPKRNHRASFINSLTTLHDDAS